jgi:TolA-binding protein
MEGEMALLIPILALCIPFFAIWTKHKQKVAQMQVESTAEHTAEKAAQYASQIQQLNDRVQVLERIVTDRGYDIATQIEALRDTRQVENNDSGTPLNMSQQERA